MCVLLVCVFYDQRSRRQHQSESGIGQQWTAEQEEELSAVSKNLSVLLREQEGTRRLKK